MKPNFHRLWNRLESILVADADSPEQRRRRATLIAISTFSVIAGIISGTNILLTSGSTTHGLIPCTFSFVVGLAIFVFFATRKFSILLYTFLFMILCTPFVFHCSLGGFAYPSTPLYWSILAPIGALLFQDVKKAVWWLVAFLVLLVTALNLDEQFNYLATPAPHGELMVAYGINIIGFSITIFLTMAYFVNAFTRENARAERLLSDLRQTNNRLETTLDELQRTQSELVQSEKTAALGKLVAGIVHELNTPIGAINSATDVSGRSVDKILDVLNTSNTLDEFKNSRSLQASVDALRTSSPVATAASKRITKIVGCLKNFARLDEATFQRVDIHEGLDSTLALMAHDFGERIRVVKDYATIPPVGCHPGELNQVFLNLLTNAAEAIKGPGTITIRTSVVKDNILIQISDTGDGLSPDQIQGVFDPGFTKTGTRVRAGLGMFTSYNIVQKHNGQIKVESALGEGSTFAITLPIH